VAVLEDPQRIDLSLEPLDDYVVVQPSDEEAETKTGLIIPASAESVCVTGIVTAIGTEAGGIEPGDKVLFPKDAGFEVRLHGSEVKVLRRGELIARIND
jgi:chaperonin GroES